MNEMAIYEVDEIRFELPDGYADRSMNLFLEPPETAKGLPKTLVVTRERRTEETLSQQTAGLLRSLAEASPGTRVLGQRDRVIGALPGREARSHGTWSGKPLYQRHLFVGHYQSLLSFIVTSARAESARCDEVAEQVIASLKLRRR